MTIQEIFFMDKWMMGDGCAGQGRRYLGNETARASKISPPELR